MTPELRIACEVVFQEHKVTSQPIKWNSNTFRGRISLGLSDLAKDTLVKKNIIILPKKSKKIITLLNPAVATAASFEEAEVIIKNKLEAAIADVPDNHRMYAAQRVSAVDIPQPQHRAQQLSLSNKVKSPSAEMNWYMKPLFYYFVWPVCAAVAGAAISYLIEFVYAEIFLNPG